MIAKTQKRLRAARFFLQDLQNRARAFRSDPEAFEFVLEAFLSAARSVTWVLQKEEKEKYDAWFEPVWMSKLSKDDETSFRGMKKRRNAAEKEGDAGVIVEWEDIPLWEFTPSDRTNPASWGYQAFGSSVTPGIDPPRHRHPTHYFGPQETRIKAVDACVHYYELLDQLVREFLERYERP
jgi:hypothetical protein